MKSLNNEWMHRFKSSQSLASTLMRRGLGMMGTAHPKQPEKSLILYEFEACPYCRRVREVMTHLNLDYESRPSPKQGKLYRSELESKLSEMQVDKAQVPFLIDENTGDSILESQDIINHLFAYYSKEGKTPDKFQYGDNVGILNAGASMMSMLRGMKSAYPHKNKERGKPETPLELYGFEASPFCRLVREKLSELEVGYINRNTAREQLQDIGSSSVRLNLGKYKPVKNGKRERIMKEVMNGKIQVPYLVDPNTNTQMFESKDILQYLDETYG